MHRLKIDHIPNEVIYIQFKNANGFRKNNNETSSLFFWLEVWLN